MKLGGNLGCWRRGDSKPIFSARHPSPLLLHQKVCTEITTWICEGSPAPTEVPNSVLRKLHSLLEPHPGRASPLWTQSVCLSQYFSNQLIYKCKQTSTCRVPIFFYYISYAYVDDNCSLWEQFSIYFVTHISYTFQTIYMFAESKVKLLFITPIIKFVLMYTYKEDCFGNLFF